MALSWIASAAQQLILKRHQREMSRIVAQILARHIDRPAREVVAHIDVHRRLFQFQERQRHHLVPFVLPFDSVHFVLLELDLPCREATVFGKPSKEVTGNIRSMKHGNQRMIAAVVVIVVMTVTVIVMTVIVVAVVAMLRGGEVRCPARRAARSSVPGKRRP